MKKIEIKDAHKKAMGFIEEFKAFAMRGNVIDLAVGVIIGGAFGKITTSFVNDIVMPLIGMLLGGVNLKELAVAIPSRWSENGVVKLQYGMFLQSIVDFLIIAFCIFIFIRIINALQRAAIKKAEEAKKAEAIAIAQEEEKNVTPKRSEFEESQLKLLAEIRDILKKT